MTVFKLAKDHYHSGDPEFDAFHIPFPNSNMFPINMLSINDFDYPEMIYLQANFDLIPLYDYPLTDLSIHVMSNKMIELIKSVKEFSHKTIPVTMIDFTFLENLFDEAGLINNKAKTNKDYYAVQLKDYAENVLDLQNSKYRMSRVYPGEISFISKIVLKEPDNGFPSIFKIKGIADTFISHETKRILEMNNIKGCVFTPVEVSN